MGSQSLLEAGRFSEAEAELRQAQLLDPLSLHIGANLGAIYYCSRRYQDTVDQERKILDLDAHVPLARLLPARGYEGLSRYGEAEAIFENDLKTDERRCVGRLRTCLCGFRQAGPGAPDDGRAHADG